MKTLTTDPREDFDRIRGTAKLSKESRSVINSLNPGVFRHKRQFGALRKLTKHRAARVGNRKTIAILAAWACAEVGIASPIFTHCISTNCASSDCKVSRKETTKQPESAKSAASSHVSTLIFIVHLHGTSPVDRQ